MGLQTVNGIQVFSTESLDKTGAKIRIAYGKRSNGKTTNTLLTICNDIIESGGKFAYVRRRHAQIVKNKMRELFGFINSEYYIKRGKSIDYSPNKGGFYFESTGEHVGYALSLEDSYNIKSTYTFQNVKYIFFDEFLDYTYYDDEIRRFLHLISSIKRSNPNVIMYMMSNTILSNDPYFELFKIDKSKIKMGNIGVVYHKRGASIAAEYVHSGISLDKINDSLLGFDSDSVDMILYGSWETNPCNTSPIDGQSWEQKRILLPLYITRLGTVFELSFTMSKFPILFIRTVNTQNGLVSRKIKYNLSEDGKQLINKNGPVPTLQSLDFIDGATLNMIEICKKCFRSGRVIYDDTKTGTLIMNSKLCNSIL